MKLIDAHKKRVKKGVSTPTIVSLTARQFTYSDTPYHSMGVTKDNRLFTCRRVTSGFYPRILDPVTETLDYANNGSGNANCNNIILLQTGELFTTPHTYNSLASRRACYSFNSDTKAIVTRISLPTYGSFVATPQVGVVCLTETGKIVIIPTRHAGNTDWLVIDPDNGFSVVENSLLPLSSNDYGWYARGCHNGDSVYQFVRVGPNRGIAEFNYVTNSVTLHSIPGLTTDSEFMDITMGPDGFGYCFPYRYNTFTTIQKFNFSTGAVTQIAIPASVRPFNSGCYSAILLKNGLFLVIPRSSINPTYYFDPFSEQFTEVALDRNVIGDDCINYQMKYINDTLYICRNVASETGNYMYAIDVELTYGDTVLDNSVPSNLSSMPTSDFNKYFNR